ncbi:hypothetical protein RJ53_08485 [Methanocalculus chunghsingensis]|uniref:Uncharacterized protein n=1 Tax=Methanocalculus chunghsingensis TaxID=156457 RepID=A0A8J8B592_9EURY|nr:hypothetical protein [Methanocalculus chunghsingensis]MBR1369521.1 hypothetical protein [Methanocalculus chunghsingensis]
MASEGETITISHETRMKLSRLRKDGQSYDSLISTMADEVLKLSESEEEWDVEKIENDMNTIRKTTTFTPLNALSRR